jgi:hypothetical protein
MRYRLEVALVVGEVDKRALTSTAEYPYPCDGRHMPDFSKRLGQKKTVDAADPEKLFASLDRKATHTVLRPVQVEALAALKSRRAERDLILKVSTGGGKTTVGLLYLHSHMLESGRPAVYLCPTRQLVTQVLREADNLGIKAVEYPPSEPHPDPDGLRGRAIVVCTYDKLFNAKTTFLRDDVGLYPYALVLDDAHAGLAEIRDSFTLTVHRGSTFNELIECLDTGCKAYDPSMWEFIQRGERDSQLEVPYWIWAAKIEKVREILLRIADDKPHKFRWGFLKGVLRWCRCLISGDRIEIVPDVPPVHLLGPYDKADRRLFASATLSDDSVLVRELGCAAHAAEEPITLLSDGGIGERMVLAPSLISPKLDRKWVMQWAQKLSKSVAVVVLCPSERTAAEWKDGVGAQVEVGDKVQALVDNLRTGKARFAALAHRYDGVDLPDDSCRVLVVDGLPRGQTLSDEIDGRDPGSPNGSLQQWVYRIEQGMGRAVRSPVDYAVVVLCGPELASFVSRRDVVQLLGAGTRAQIELVHELAEIAKEDEGDPEKAVSGMAAQCLKRDEGWKQYYDEKVRQVARAAGAPIDKNVIAIAAAESDALRLAMTGDPPAAAQVLHDAVNKCSPPDARRGWLLQRKANYTFDSDPAAALEQQGHAHRLNPKMAVPPRGTVLRAPPIGQAAAANMVLEWYHQHDKANGAVAQFAVMKAALSFSSSVESFEEGLRELAPLFGAGGTRPERELRRGPDNMWSWPDIDWVIEAKSERGGALPKADGEQLLAAMEWHKQNYGERARLPVVVAQVPQHLPDAFFPEGTRVITPGSLAKLLAAVEQFVGRLAAHGPLFRNTKIVAQDLRECGLAASDFADRYTVPIRRTR